jgi:hypothetical protein
MIMRRMKKMIEMVIAMNGNDDNDGNSNGDGNGNGNGGSDGNSNSDGGMWYGVLAVVDYKNGRYYFF